MRAPSKRELELSKQFDLDTDEMEKIKLMQELWKEAERVEKEHEEYRKKRIQEERIERKKESERN